MYGLTKEKGAYGEVHKVVEKASGRVFAIKKIDKNKIRQQGMVSQIWTQINIMYQINHRNIIRLYDHFQNDNYLCLVMEYVSKGSLFSQLVKNKRLSELATKSIMKDIISAVEYLHKMNPPIVHRDIKPQNILMDENDNAKLADFGWSNYSNILRVTYCGTQSYLSPEMVLKSGHDKRLDYWSLGVLCYELLSGCPPFDCNLKNQVERKKKLHDNILNLRYTFESYFSQYSKQFISGLLKVDPSQRMNIKDMKSHQFLSDSMLMSKKLEEQRREPIESQANQQLIRKLNDEQKTVWKLTHRVMELQEKVKRLGEEAEEYAIKAEELEEELQQKCKMIDSLQAKIETMQKQMDKFSEVDKKNQQLLRAIDDSKEQEEAQEARIQCLLEELRLIKESYKDIQDRYFKLQQQKRQVIIREKIEDTEETIKEKQQLRSKLIGCLEQLTKQVQQSKQADKLVQKQAKYLQMERQIEQLKELEYERQRTFEVQAENYESRLSEMVNTQNMQVQKLLHTIRSLQDAKKHSDLMLDFYIMSNIK